MGSICYFITVVSKHTSNLKMSDKEAKTFAFPLRNGNYKATGNWYTFLFVDGAKAILKDPLNAQTQGIIKVGDFGEADPEVVKLSGKKSYNIEITYSFGQNVIEHGVLSGDGLKMISKGMMGIAEMEWVTEEEVARLEAEGDPIEAPPGEYKIQPEYQGKFLWITGPAGLGKSTSAQLLGRNYGYVFYESDCFGSIKNPYIPVNAENPTMAQVHQKALKGEGLERRRRICNATNAEFMELFSGKEFDIENFRELYTIMCEDIIRERKRIGGDWAVAGVAFTRSMRDHIRSILGQDLLFVILSMDKEEVRKRVTDRHQGDEQAADLVKSVNNLCEPIGEDEENAVDVAVTADMTRDDVVKKILDLVK